MPPYKETKQILRAVLEYDVAAATSYCSTTLQFPLENHVVLRYDVVFLGKTATSYWSTTQLERRTAVRRCSFQWKTTSCYCTTWFSGQECNAVLEYDAELERRTGVRRCTFNVVLQYDVPGATSYSSTTSQFPPENHVVPQYDVVFRGKLQRRSAVRRCSFQ